MATEYAVIIYDTSGNKQAEVFDYLELTYNKRIWEPGYASVTMSASNNAVKYLTQDCIVAIERRNLVAGISFYTDFVGIYKDLTIQTPVDHDLLTIGCPGVMWLLSAREVAYTGGIANFSLFTSVAAETVMKRLVDYNVGANATTANGRDRTPNSLGVSIAADGGRGNVIDWKCSYQPVLTEMQNIAKAGAGGDFDLTWNGVGTATYSFDFYPGQRGTDRRSTVTFATDYGNMRMPRYTYSRKAEATVCIVKNRSITAAQAAVVQTGANYSTTNDIETFVTCNETDTTSYRNAKSSEALWKHQARRHLEFQPIQTAAYQYGRDYFLGDLVTARYQGITFQPKLFGITVHHERNAAETIEVETQDV